MGLNWDLPMGMRKACRWEMHLATCLDEHWDQHWVHWSVPLLVQHWVTRTVLNSDRSLVNQTVRHWEIRWESRLVQSLATVSARRSVQYLATYWEYHWVMRLARRWDVKREH